MTCQQHAAMTCRSRRFGSTLKFQCLPKWSLPMAFRFASLRGLARVLPTQHAMWMQQSRAFTARATMHTHFEKTKSYCKVPEGMATQARNEMVKNICAELQKAQDDFEKPLMVMFVGAYNAGKSTLINSLMRDNVCKTGMKPTTSDLHFIKWGDCLLVDSPGLDAMNQKEHRQKSLEATRRSNVAVVVVHALKPLTNSEREILDELKNAESQVIVMLNWNYMNNEDDQEECLAYVKETFAELMPNHQPQIIPVNAKCSEDPGVKDLKQSIEAFHLHSDSQKSVSAKVAIAGSGKNMLDALAEFERDLGEERIRKEIEQQDQLLQPEESKLKSLRNELEELGTFAGEVAKGFCAGAMAGRFAGPYVFQVGGCGVVIGAIHGCWVELERVRIEKEIKEIEDGLSQNRYTQARARLRQELNQVMKRKDKIRKSVTELKTHLSTVEGLHSCSAGL